MDISTLRGQIGQYDKTTLFRQLGYFGISNVLGHIVQNVKTTVSRQLAYIGISTLRLQI